MTPIISTNDFSNLDNFIVVDCRHNLQDSEQGRKSYLEGHIPESFFLHADEDLSNKEKIEKEVYGRHPLPEKKAFVQKLASIGANNDTLLIAVDDASGVFSARFWWLCKWIGHDKCCILDGGIDAWKRSNFELTTKITHPKKGAIQPRPNLCAQWTYGEIRAWVNDKSNDKVCLLLDARAKERFEGLVEPIDKKAGHIPGAINRPFSENLDESGLFKPKNVLKKEFLSLLDERDSSSVVHMCGSGITACHNLLSMEIAGLTDSALYAGSWSEWCNQS
ncbi:MAG: hypothetical protein CBC42_07205 [Betaproteobacteria bacterium TMED82]|nr:MAG: hypothetical protein CBC42_07205 [Betaproteobacteria bacterium TMED82]|tara:strand:- start:43669 stop:44499 length:831 start_codon:yes stop_codon:yes gene_type:complete